MHRRNTLLPAAILAALALGAAASPASAQWTAVAQVPAVNLNSVSVKGDTIVAGSDSTVFVSVDSGVSWLETAKVASGVTSVEVVRVHDGRLYAGTYGQGVLVSGDFGTSWQAFNTGLTGGFANSQLAITDLLVANGNLHAATAGSGAWIRSLAVGGWSPYGNAFEPAQAANMEALAASPTRLLAAAGFNGQVFHRDSGQPDWTESLLLNDHPAPGLAPLALLWTGQSWLVGTNLGVFRSALGQSPWTFFDFGISPILTASFTRHGAGVLTHFVGGGGTQIHRSTDDGVSWQPFDSQPFVLTYEIAVAGDVLYEARVDGLWRRPLETTTVPPASGRAQLRLTLVGAQPARDDVRLRFELPQAAQARLDLFDVSGRRVEGVIDEPLPAGTHEARCTLRGLPPGLYLARLEAGGRSSAVRVVRTQ